MVVQENRRQFLLFVTLGPTKDQWNNLIFLWMHARLYLCVRAYVHACMHACVCACVRVCVCGTPLTVFPACVFELS